MQLRSAQVAGQWRGDTALTLPLFWRRSTVSPVFFGRFPRSSQSPCPLPTLSPSLIGHPASVDVKQHKRKLGTESRRNSRLRSDLDSHELEEVRLSFADPGEIKRREVVLEPGAQVSEPRTDRSRAGRWHWAAQKVGLPSFAAFGHCSSTAVLRTSSLSVTLLCTAVKRATVLYTSCYGGNVEAGDTA